MSTYPEVCMPLQIDHPTNWWAFTNSPEQDPELLASEAYRLSSVIVPVEQFADAIFGDHDAILGRTTEALGMEIADFMKAVHHKQIIWRSHLLGKWVQARSSESQWMPVPGVYACPLEFRRSRQHIAPTSPPPPTSAP